VAVVEKILEAESAGARQRVRFDETADIGACLGCPAAAAEQHHRALRRGEQLAKPRHVVRARMRLRGHEAPRIADRGLPGEHVLRQREDHGAAASGSRDLEGARDEFGNARAVVDAVGPLGERREHRAEVDLLEGLAPAEVGAHVADEKDHRRRILERGVHPDRGVRCARAARREADAGTIGELAVRFGHVGRARLVAAGDEPQAIAHLVEPVEDRQEAFPGHGEGEVHAMDDQLVGEDVPADALAHFCFTT
jgi:hypothetical protein